MANSRISVALGVVIWFLVLVTISFPTAMFAAAFYILLLPFTVCVKDLTEATDFLLKGVQLPYLCVDNIANKRTWEEGSGIEGNAGSTLEEGLETLKKSLSNT